MRRSTVLSGLVTIGAMVIAQNVITPSQVANPVPTIYFLVAACLWYAAGWVNTIKEWKRRPVMLFGRYKYTAGPGLTFIEPLFYTTLTDVTVQEVTKMVSAKGVQTKDNVSVGLTAVLTYRINPAKVRDAVVEVSNVEQAIMNRALAVLTDVPATMDLDGLLEHREQLGTKLVEKLAGRLKGWGVEVIAYELQAFKINDVQIEQAIAMRARAQKEAEAELARANMQEQIAGSLNKAAATLTPEGWRLKGIETFLEAVRGQNNTILIPASLAEGLGHMLPRVDMPTAPTLNGAAPPSH
jgi:regulator of protease activity HflC (stomatin/prohibitin superfamily)